MKKHFFRIFFYYQYFRYLRTTNLNVVVNYYFKMYGLISVHFSVLRVAEPTH